MKVFVCRYRRHACLAIVLMVTLASPPLPISSSHAGWRDKLRGAGQRAKQTASRARENLKKREHSCSSCGKTIRFGTRCVSCNAKRAVVAGKRTAAEGKKRWNESAHPCSMCGKTIHVGKTCASCLAKAGKDKWDKKAHPCSMCGKTIHVGKTCASCLGRAGKKKWEAAKPRIQAAHQKASAWYGRNKEMLAQRAKEAHDRYGPAVMSALRDPENQRKALETIGMVMKVRRQIRAAQRESTYRALKALSNLPIPTDSGTRTLHDIAKGRLLEKMPYLEGSGIAEDPAGSLTALLMRDRNYLMTQVPIVRKGGRQVSVVDAISQSSSLNTGMVMKCIELMDAMESVSNAAATGEDSLDAIERTMSIMGHLK